MTYRPMCPNCGDTGLVARYTGWKESQVEVAHFCHCAKGRAMQRDYEKEKEEWEDVRLGRTRPETTHE